MSSSKEHEGVRLRQLWLQRSDQRRRFTHAALSRRLRLEYFSDTLLHRYFVLFPRAYAQASQMGQRQVHSSMNHAVLLGTGH